MATAEPRPIRIGNAEREHAVQALGEHFAQGRLEPDEFEERMTAAYAARTADELHVLFVDLPHAGAHHPGPAPGGPYPTGAPPALRPAAGPYATAPVGPTTAYPVGPPHPAPGYDLQAPHGREPVTGQPYSDRSKVVAGLLQVLLPFGVGRFYSGHAAIGVAQLVLSLFGIGILWAFLDGLVILLGRPTDPYGRPLRP